MSIEHAPARGRRLISWAAVCERVGRNRSTIWRWVKSGRFPAPFEVGGFDEAEVDVWFDGLKRVGYAPAPAGRRGHSRIARGNGG